MTERGIRHHPHLHPLDMTGNSTTRPLDQEREIARLRQRVLQLHRCTGETASFEQVWFRWVQLIDAFDLDYAAKLVARLEQRAGREV